jgi:hypothetical protein
MPGERGYVISPADRTTLLEGPLGAFLMLGGDRTAGSLSLVKPRGVVHAFWNPADQPARLLEIISPAGFEGYFAGLGEIFAGQAPPDPGRVAELAGRYGLDLDRASVPRLAAAHGLRVPGAPPGTS